MVNVKMLPYSQGILGNSIVLFVHYSKETDIPGYELFMAALLWVTFIKLVYLVFKNKIIFICKRESVI